MVFGTSIIYLLLHLTIALAVLSMFHGVNACRRHDDSNRLQIFVWCCLNIDLYLTTATYSCYIQFLIYAFLYFTLTNSLYLPETFKQARI